MSMRPRVLHVDARDAAIEKGDARSCELVSALFAFFAALGILTAPQVRARGGCVTRGGMDGGRGGQAVLGFDRVKAALPDIVLDAPAARREFAAFVDRARPDGVLPPSYDAEAPAPDSASPVQFDMQGVPAIGGALDDT